MKIAIFSDCYLDLTGGIVTAINSEKAELERLGHTVYVFSSSYPKDQRTTKKLASEHIFPVPSCKVFGRGLTPIARRPGLIEKWLLKTHPELRGFDIFYSHYEAGCSIAGLRLARRLGISSIQVMYGREDSGEEDLVPFGLRTFVATMLCWFHSWYLPHPTHVHRDKYLATTIARAKMWTLMVNHANVADLVITPSEHFRKKLLHYGVKREIVALHHGSPFEKQAKLPRSYDPSGPLEIIWHSRVSGEKRILPFLKALGLVKGRYHLTVYGDGPELKRAKNYAAKHNLNVTFKGLAPLETIKNQIAKSHLDVLVSYNFDTFGMTLVEAANFGVPTFIADPDLSEVLTPGAYFLSTTPAPEQMAAKIDEIISDPASIKAASQAALSHHQFSSADKAKQLEKLMKTLLPKK